MAYLVSIRQQASRELPPDFDVTGFIAGQPAPGGRAKGPVRQGGRSSSRRILPRGSVGLAETLGGSNVEAARTALRGLVGTVPVFAEGRKLYGRLGLGHAQLMRSSNPHLIESCGSGGPLRAL
jgi:hypothetical protein